MQRWIFGSDVGSESYDNFPHSVPAFLIGFRAACVNRGKSEGLFNGFHPLFQLSSFPQPRFRKLDNQLKFLSSTTSAILPLFHAELRVLRAYLSFIHPQKAKAAVTQPLTLRIGCDPAQVRNLPKPRNSDNGPFFHASASPLSG